MKLICHHINSADLSWMVQPSLTDLFILGFLCFFRVVSKRQSSTSAIWPPCSRSLWTVGWNSVPRIWWQNLVCSLTIIFFKLFEVKVIAWANCLQNYPKGWVINLYIFRQCLKRKKGVRTKNELFRTQLIVYIGHKYQ